MTQATATTALKGGRQHGGGLVHANQPRNTLRSRPQIPSGGAIKSLCCAAAGILPPLLRATTGRVYPTTCVRRAPDQSEPLRSTNRPHAQLVVGYKTPKSPNYPSEITARSILTQDRSHQILNSANAREIRGVINVDHQTASLNRNAILNILMPRDSMCLPNCFQRPPSEASAASCAVVGNVNLIDIQKINQPHLKLRDRCKNLHETSLILTCPTKAEGLPASIHNIASASDGKDSSSTRLLAITRNAANLQVCPPNALFNNGVRNQGERALCLVPVFLQVIYCLTENGQKFVVGSVILQVIDKNYQNTADIGRNFRAIFICLLFKTLNDAIEIPLEECRLVTIWLSTSLNSALSLYSEIAYINGIPTEPQCKQPFPVHFLSAVFCHLGFPLMPWDRYGYKNCQNRTHRLHPSRSSWCSPRQHPDQTSWNNYQRGKNKNLQNRARPKPDSELFGDHYWLLASKTAASLPALPFAVHGGGA